jgi:general stress protein 26
MNQREENHEKIWSLIKDARVAMLTTTRNGRLYSRPMVASQKHFDGTLWFFTRKSSPKVDEVAGHHEVNVAYASAEAIDEHWNQFVATWFPDGKDDPDLALLRVDIDTAEYWDAPSSKMAVAFDYIKARVTGSQLDVGDHGKLDV